MKKDDVDIEEQVAETQAMQRRASGRHRAIRIVSLFLPGSHAFASPTGPSRAAAILLCCSSSAVGAAVLDERLLRSAVASAARARARDGRGGRRIAGGFVWLRAQWGARRVPSGS